MGGSESEGARLRLSDDGFTLVEAVVALFILGIIFTALAYAATGALRASLNSRAEQQAIDFATEALESARQADYYSLANLPTVSGTAVVTCGADKCIDPGTGIPERIITSSTGSAQTDVAVNSALGNRVNYRISTYVTDPDDDAGDYKRVTVITEWSIAGKQRSRVMSSLVTVTDRGLPIPVFKLTPLGGTAQAVNPGALASFNLELTNQGAPDHFNLVVAPSATWLFYLDDGDGVLCLNPFDPALSGLPVVDCPGLVGTDYNYDVALTDTSGDFIVDTGRVDPTATLAFWAIRPIPTEATPGDLWTNLSATSVAAAGESTGSTSVDLLVQVVTGTVTSSPEPPPVVTETPGPPQDLAVTPGNATLALSWTSPISPGSSAVTDYVVRYKVTGTPTWTILSDGVGTTTAATITSLLNTTEYDIQVTAMNAQGEGAIGATAMGTPEIGSAYLAPVRCIAASPPAAVAASGYTLRSYSLHNRSSGNPTWPGTGLPQPSYTYVGGTPTGQGIPLTMSVDSPQFPQATNLPIYSQDVVVGQQGRVINTGGSLTTAETPKVVDWRATTTGKQYSGEALLTFWVAPVQGDATAGLGYTLKAQLYKQKTTQSVPQDDKLNGNAKSQPWTITASSFSCGADGQGWQMVVVALPVLTSSALGSTESIGVRLWNAGGTNMIDRVRIAYDVAGDSTGYPNFPATLTLPEK